jgi:hypothetical protein
MYASFGANNDKDENLSNKDMTTGCYCKDWISKTMSYNRMNLVNSGSISGSETFSKSYKLPLRSLY